MSRSFRDVLKFSVPTLLCAAMLSGCGSGSSGSADLNQGGSVQQPPPPVTVTETFNFKATADYFVVGTPPIHARFSGGQANGNGAWVVPEGQTAVIDFGTPADTVKFSTQDDFTAAAALGAQKTGASAGAARKTDPPFNVPMYVRGTVNDSWAQTPPESNRMEEIADNVLAVVMAVEPGDYKFKIADAGWGPTTNCGFKSAAEGSVTLGVPLPLSCTTITGGDISLTIPKAADYLFALNVIDQGNPTVTVEEFTDDGGGNGGGEEPEDSTEIRIYAVDTLTAGAKPALYAAFTGTGVINIDEIVDRTGRSPRITRIEIENFGTAGDIGIADFTWTANPQFAPANVKVSISYTRPAATTAGTRIEVGGQTYNCTPLASGVGCSASGVAAVPFANASMTVINADGSRETITFNAGNGSEGVYAFSGSPTARIGTPGEAGEPAAQPRNAKEVILFYKRDDNDYTGWGLHLFPLDPAGDPWTLFPTPGEFPYEGIDPQWGAYFRIALPGRESPRYSNNPPAIDTFPKALGFIIHKGNTKDPGPDQVIRIAEDGNTVFVVSGLDDVGTVPPGSGTSLRISGAAAHWVDQDSLLWNPPEGVTKVELLYSPNGSINVGLQGITGTFETIALASGSNPKPAFNTELHNLKAWDLPSTAAQKAKDVARGQLVAIGRNASNEAIAGTLVQTAGALDALYADQASGKTLGVSYASGVPSLAIWAPTALKDPGLTVNVYDAAGAKIESKPMTLDEASGVWSVTGTSAWDRKFYTISLRVYSYATNSIVTNEVTDPYSVSLATDSVRSQFVNLNDADLKPAGWDTLTPPALAAPEDIVLYELHVRDFSIADQSVPPADRGKFTAFDVPGTTGRSHLQALAAAGLTHVHILPAFDFAPVKENPADQVNLDDKVEKLCAANSAAASLCSTDAGKTIRQAMQDAVATKQLDRPAQITDWMRNLDGFNWGYDPLHFGAPEGSYSTDSNGAKRIYEFRRMVKGLNELGLRTVMDVVYNHTNASGQNGRATLDRLVPGYYHRRDIVGGNVLTKSCCQDTAPEFRMMEKLVTDTGVTWVRDYKVSGFRFDIMTMHPLESIRRFRDTVTALDPSVYIYGEGWAASSYLVDTRFKTSEQANLGGTGIGSFSDRIRDPVRGGGPFDGGSAHVQNQGFISGWFYAPNAQNSGSTAERDALTKASDNIRAWLAGGLASYRFTNSAGNVVTGADVDYRGQKSGYTKDPQEAVNYASKHDNETIWDISQYKHATGTPLAERVRADNVATSVIMLAQGIPFIHAGTELLRSKSMDRNSYDSGDWYNEIDWTGATSKWNQGLPRPADNSGNVEQVKNVILDVTAVQDQAARDAALANFKELLAIRKSSPLFRLRTQSQIDQRLKFYNTGPFQIPGVIAMAIDGCAEPNLTPAEGALMVIFNASDDPRTLNLFGNETWTLHPVQQGSADSVVKTAKHDANGFFVPARTTAVFRRASQTSCAPYPRDLYVRGSLNDWANPPPDTYRMQFLGGTDYTLTAPVAAGSQAFKIAGADWNAADTDCGAAVDGVNVRLGVPVTLTCKAGTKNLGLTAAAAGNYTFALDATSTANPVLTVSKSPPTPLTLYVRGGFTDWGTSLPLVWDGAGTYRATAAIAAANVGSTQFFKIADFDWGNTNNKATDCGGAVGSTPTVTLGTPFALTCAADTPNLGITFPSVGSYLFAVNWANPAAPQLTVEKVPVEALYVRGAFNDWGKTDRLSYLGGGTYALNKALAATAAAFKVADADYNPVNCGGGAGGNTVTVGTTLALACGVDPPNLSLTPPTAGTYTFTVKINDASSAELTVTGP